MAPPRSRFVASSSSAPQGEVTRGRRKSRLQSVKAKGWAVGKQVELSGGSGGKRSRGGSSLGAKKRKTGTGTGTGTEKRAGVKGTVSQLLSAKKAAELLPLLGQVIKRRAPALHPAQMVSTSTRGMAGVGLVLSLLFLALVCLAFWVRWRERERERAHIERGVRERESVCVCVCVCLCVCVCVGVGVLFVLYSLKIPYSFGSLMDLL